MKIPKNKYNIGDEVWIVPYKSEYAPFRGWVMGIRVDYDKLDYTIAEDKDGKYQSDGYTEDMIERDEWAAHGTKMIRIGVDD